MYNYILIDDVNIVEIYIASRDSLAPYQQTAAHHALILTLKHAADHARLCNRIMTNYVDGISARFGCCS